MSVSSDLKRNWGSDDRCGCNLDFHINLSHKIDGMVLIGIAEIHGQKVTVASRKLDVYACCEH